jgi:hypothetical protein
MKRSIIDFISLSELRMWALSGLWQYPHLIPDADGMAFISSGVALPIFTAMRNLYEIDQPVTLPNIFIESGKAWDVAIGLAALPAVTMTEEQARCYLRRLSKRFDFEEEQYAAA